MSEAQQRLERKHKVWSETAAMAFVKGEQRLRSQHHPETRTEAAYQDELFWTAHDLNADGSHSGNYAVCETCLGWWREWKDARLQERLAAAAMAESL